jgi:hypothetical protein
MPVGDQTRGRSTWTQGYDKGHRPGELAADPFGWRRCRFEVSAGLPYPRSSPCYPADREQFQRYKLARASTQTCDDTRPLSPAHTGSVARCLAPRPGCIALCSHLGPCRLFSHHPCATMRAREKRKKKLKSGNGQGSATPMPTHTSELVPTIRRNDLRVALNRLGPQAKHSC